MKKILGIIFISILVILLNSCQGSNENVKNNSTKSPNGNEGEVTVNNKKNETQVTNKIEDKNNTNDEKNINENIDLNEEKLDSDYKLSVYSWVSDNYDLTHATIIGAYKDNKWYSIEDFEFIYNGEPIKYADVEKKIQREGIEVKTPFIKDNETFKFYSADNQVVNAQVTGMQKIYMFQSSGQVFLEIKLKPVKVKTNKALIGINGDWDAMNDKAKSEDNIYKFDIDLNEDGKKEKVDLKLSIDGYLNVYENFENSKVIFTQDLGD